MKITELAGSEIRACMSYALLFLMEKNDTCVLKKMLSMIVFAQEKLKYFARHSLCKAINLTQEKGCPL